MSRRRPVAGLIAAALIVAAVSAPADAQQVEARMEFVERELNRRCAIDGLSRGDLGGVEVSTTRCRATVRPGRIMIEVRGRALGASGAGRLTRTEMEIDFDSRAFFYCARPDGDGFSTLYMNCDGLETLTGRACIARSVDGGPAERRAFTILISTPQEACRRIRRALSFIAERTRDRELSDF